MPEEEPPSSGIGFSPLTIVRMVWKRKLLIALVWALLAAGSFLVVKRLPAVYMSEALILVDSQKIPEKFVSATVASDLQDRITTIRQQIMSTGKLQKIIDDLGLYQQERKTHFQEEVLEMMRRDISIKVEDSGAAGAGRPARPGAFRIGYQGPDPALVTQVANRLTNLYVEENLKTRTVQAEGTSDFLETQLQEAKKRLDEMEAAVSAYKLKHNGELPQQEISLTGALSRLQVELEANRDAVNRAQQTKIILENSLSAAEGSLAAQLRVVDAARQAAGLREDEPLPAQAGAPAAPRRSEVLQAELDVLRTRYRDAHPDVVRLRAEVERLKKAEQREPAAERTPQSPASARQTARRPAPAVSESPELVRTREQVANLKAQIKGIDKELETRQVEQARILRDIATHQSRVERLPVREQEMAGITRDYEISKENYKSILDKKMAADIALDMERRQKSERFTVLDPARVPEKPIKPKRPILYGASMAVSLVLALFLGVALEFRKNVILGEWELPRDTVILARLPHIEVSPAPVDPKSTARREGRGKGLLVPRDV